MNLALPFEANTEFVARNMAHNDVGVATEAAEVAEVAEAARKATEATGVARNAAEAVGA